MTERDHLSVFKSGEAVFGVIGLGYVGLPLALTFAESGVRVLGFDIDEAKTAKLNAGVSYIRQIPSKRVAAAAENGLLGAVTDFERLAEVDAVAICVPTPLDGHRQPDLSYVHATSREIAKRLRPGQLIILESTTYPGTTREEIQPLLEEGSGLTAGKDFFLAFSPEREDPGNKRFNTRTIPKVLGGLTPRCLEAARALYEPVFERVVPVSSPEVAELTKIFENTFRGVNIALVNELKLLCLKMGLDVHEVIAAANTKPFGFMAFWPGPGLGGHCIPIDPFYLTYKAHEYGMSTRFIELSGEINSAMPGYVVERVAAALNSREKPLKGSRVLVLGIAYKPDIDDMRESPAVPVMEGLIQRGARVEYHDPFIPAMPATRQTELRLESVELGDDYAALADYDAVVIVTNHSTIDYPKLVERSQLVVDTRNATAGHRPGDKVWLA
ncbi:MAG: nucleotide sugar dehydrogenase [Candidatus Coatesbacteria bacterium]|nr:nucleotide sugar dehydrogenase [Candidatus Coatesbacteria bacterium]